MRGGSKESDTRRGYSWRGERKNFFYFFRFLFRKMRIIALFLLGGAFGMNPYGTRSVLDFDDESELFGDEDPLDPYGFETNPFGANPFAPDLYSARNSARFNSARRNLQWANGGLGAGLGGYGLRAAVVPISPLRHKARTASFPAPVVSSGVLKSAQTSSGVPKSVPRRIPVFTQSVRPQDRDKLVPYTVPTKIIPFDEEVVVPALLEEEEEEETEEETEKETVVTKVVPIQIVPGSEDKGGSEVGVKSEGEVGAKGGSEVGAKSEGGAKIPTKTHPVELISTRSIIPLVTGLKTGYNMFGTGLVATGNQIKYLYNLLPAVATLKKWTRNALGTCGSYLGPVVIPCLASVRRFAQYAWDKCVTAIAENGPIMARGCLTLFSRMHERNQFSAIPNQGIAPLGNDGGSSDHIPRSTTTEENDVHDSITGELEDLLPSLTSPSFVAPPLNVEEQIREMEELLQPERSEDSGPQIETIAGNDLVPLSEDSGPQIEIIATNDLVELPAVTTPNVPAEAFIAQLPGAELRISGEETATLFGFKKIQGKESAVLGGLDGRLKTLFSSVHRRPVPDRIVVRKDRIECIAEEQVFAAIYRSGQLDILAGVSGSDDLSFTPSHTLSPMQEEITHLCTIWLTIREEVAEAISKTKAGGDLATEFDGNLGHMKFVPVTVVSSKYVDKEINGVMRKVKMVTQSDGTVEVIPLKVGADGKPIPKAKKKVTTDENADPNFKE